MNFFYIINAKKLKQLLIIIVGALFASTIVYSQSVMQATVFSTQNGPKAVSTGDTKGKKVALTFDISWGDEKAAVILKTLKDNGISNATFFLSGEWAERHPDLVQQIKKDGHEIGSMGYAWKNYTSLEDEKIRRDLLLAQDVFIKLGFKDIALLRPPTGNFNENVINIADKLNLHVIHWSIDTKDWTNPGTNIIVEQASQMKAGDILLLHASDSVKQTDKALPEIIKIMKNKGLKNVTVTELLSNAEAKNKDIN